MSQRLSCPKPCAPKGISISICLFLLFLWYRRLDHWLRERPYDIRHQAPFVQPLSESTRKSSEAIPPKTRCPGFPPNVWNDVQVVVRVRASEVHTKLAAQLATNAACVKDMLVFSDYEERVGDQVVLDALALLPKSYWKDNPDYEIYRGNWEARDSGQVVKRANEGWKLDKYKYLPMMDLTYQMRPSKKWYVFIEADTYVFWDSLFRFLAYEDPTKAAYIGSPVWRDDPEPAFAHGGSGIVLSGVALKRLVRPAGQRHYLAGITQFGVELENQCCGDAAVADLFQRRGIELRGYWPMFNSDKHYTVRFGDRWHRREQWCEPIITLHNVNETDMRELGDWEMRRASTGPVIFEELYRWLKPKIPQHRENWVVYPGFDTSKLPDFMAASPQACESSCRGLSWCYQWQFRNNTCSRSPWIRVGKEQLPDRQGNVVTSGTILDRVAAFEKRVGHCKHAHWVRANP